MKDFNVIWLVKIETFAIDQNVKTTTNSTFNPLTRNLQLDHQIYVPIKTNNNMPCHRVYDFFDNIDYL